MSNNCAYCNLGAYTNGLGPLLGPILIKNKKLDVGPNCYYHRKCVLWSGEFWSNTEIPTNQEDIKNSIQRARKLKCRFCGQKGASVGCSELSCRSSYHYPCISKHKALALEPKKITKDICRRFFCVKHKLQTAEFFKKLHVEAPLSCIVEEKPDTKGQKRKSTSNSEDIKGEKTKQPKIYPVEGNILVENNNNNNNKITKEKDKEIMVDNKINEEIESKEIKNKKIDDDDILVTLNFNKSINDDNDNTLSPVLSISSFSPPSSTLSPLPATVIPSKSNEISSHHHQLQQRDDNVESNIEYRLINNKPTGIKYIEDKLIDIRIYKDSTTYYNVKMKYIFGLYTLKNHLITISSQASGLNFENALSLDSGFEKHIKSWNLFNTSICSINNSDCDIKFNEFCQMLNLYNAVGYYKISNYSFYLVQNIRRDKFPSFFNELLEMYNKPGIDAFIIMSYTPSNF